MNYQISGVFDNFPSYSTIQSDFISNIDNAFSLMTDLTYMVGMSDSKNEVDYLQSWDHNEFSTFVLLHSNSNAASVEEKMEQIALKHREENPEKGIWLQPISKMYLHSGELNGTDSFLSNQLASLKIFMGIAFLILLVAIINFILISNSDNNLSINEIACRKVNGASKKQILFDSIFKSVSIAFISLIPSMLFVWIMMPLFNNLFQKDLSLSLFMQWPYITALIIVTLITGISAGLYLGLFVSSVNPAALFQKRIMKRGKYAILNGSLVIVQFIVFILLSSSFLLMYKQYKYSLNKDLGLSISNLIAININNNEMMNQAEYLKNQIQSNPNVIDCRPTSFTIPPSDNFLNFSYRDPETDKAKEQEALVVGRGIIEMLNIPVVEGRTFNETDQGFAENFILNEAAAKKYNVKVGDKVGPFDVIGIVKNFHFHSLHRPVEPVFIALQAKNYPYLLVKTNGRNNEVIEYIRGVCQEISPGYFMEYEVMEDRNANFYKKEEKQMGTIGFFSIIALVVSTMGLIGFVSLNLVKKTKEIGIRKINGATITELIRAHNTQYLGWILIAFVISTPVAYYGISKWLENFAYKTALSWWVFGLTGLLAIAIAMLTVSLQSWKAATRNPVEALRYE
ncbi:MAG: ABC transporter permease [Prolixibacteraceae bacterium]|nr:ABC transporter permease [Prolixibacteraceae bacterium]